MALKTGHLRFPSSAAASARLTDLNSAYQYPVSGRTQAWQSAADTDGTFGSLRIIGDDEVSCLGRRLYSQFSSDEKNQILKHLKSYELACLTATQYAAPTLPLTWKVPIWPNDDVFGAENIAMVATNGYTEASTALPNYPSVSIAGFGISGNSNKLLRDPNDSTVLKVTLKPNAIRSGSGMTAYIAFPVGSPLIATWATAEYDVFLPADFYSTYGTKMSGLFLWGGDLPSGGALPDKGFSSRITLRPRFSLSGTANIPTNAIAWVPYGYQYRHLVNGTPTIYQGDSGYEAYPDLGVTYEGPVSFTNQVFKTYRVPGKWMRIKLEVKLNSAPGVFDGFYNFYLDDKDGKGYQLQHSEQQIEFITSNNPTMKIEGVGTDAFDGGNNSTFYRPTEQSCYFRDLVYTRLA